MISLHALVQAGALAQRCGKRRVAQAARVGFPGAPALLTELQDAGLGEGAVGLTLIRSRLHLVPRHAAAVLRPGHGDTVRVKALSHTHHTDITLRERRSRSQQEQGRRRRRTLRYHYSTGTDNFDLTWHHHQGTLLLFFTHL